MTAGNRQYYVYRYEGSLNGVENAVVLISYPREAFHCPKVLPCINLYRFLIGYGRDTGYISVVSDMLQWKNF